MSDLKKISDDLINQLSISTESNYSTITNDMKDMIVNMILY